MQKIYEPAAKLVDTLLHDRVVSRIWDQDISVWGAEPGSADAASITTRLGWLDVGNTMTSELDRVIAVADGIKDEGIEAVYLLGMGGSSLCAEVMRSVYGIVDGYPDLFVLDTTDERALTTAAGRVDPARTVFLVASKSGGTVEVSTMERFFWAQMSAALGAGAGRHFIAVTDPGTALQKLAESRGYREIFINPPDIGGRFSVLSLFGLVPAALIGAPVRDLHNAGAVMAEGCRQENHENAGLILGAYIAATALDRRDKLTLALSPRLRALGLWIEQLVAESTGKHGRGSLPVVDEPLGNPADYGPDRAFVALSTESDAPDLDRLAALEHAGHPVLRLRTRADALGSEFFRWEFATAIAGAALGINPFDEPDVSEAKEQTRTLLQAHAASGQLNEPSPVATDDDAMVFSARFSGESPAEVIRSAIASVKPGDYVAFLSYLPPGSDVETALADVRTGLRARTKAASTFGVGPRYLHSTGQYHKGGPDTMVAFVITADDETATAIPDTGYSFSVLKRAQALGDVQTLEAHGRRTVRIHVSEASTAAETIKGLFAQALSHADVRL